MRNAEINLKDLMKKIFQQWRILLIAMLVCALAFTVVGGIMSQQKAAEAEKALEEQMANGGPAEGEELIVVPKVVFVSPMNIVIGLVAGAVIVALCVAVVYALSSKLRCSSDMAQGFGVSVIGVHKLERKKRFLGGLDHVIDVWFLEGKNIPADVNAQIIKTDIFLAAKKKGIQNVCFTGNVKKDDVKAIVQGFKTSNEEADIKVVFEELAIYSPKALEKMLNSEGVVLFEKIGKSAFVDIQKELAYCERYNIPVLGCVVVD